MVKKKIDSSRSSALNDIIVPTCGTRIDRIDNRMQPSCSGAGVRMYCTLRSKSYFYCPAPDDSCGAAVHPSSPSAVELIHKQQVHGGQLLPVCGYAGTSLPPKPLQPGRGNELHRMPRRFPLRVSCFHTSRLPAGHLFRDGGHQLHLMRARLLLSLYRLGRLLRMSRWDILYWWCFFLRTVFARLLLPGEDC